MIQEIKMPSAGQTTDEATIEWMANNPVTNKKYKVMSVLFADTARDAC